MGQIPYQTQLKDKCSHLTLHICLIRFYCCTVLKDPQGHRLLLSFSLCPTPVRHRKRDKRCSEDSYNFNLLP